MALNTKEELIAFAEKVGLDSGLPKGYMTTMMAIESNFRPSIVNSLGYAGLYQFGKSTGEQYGLVGDGFDYRLDPEKNTMAAARLAIDNAKDLKSRGIENPTPADLYGAHQQGASGWAGYRKLADDPNAKLSDIQIKRMRANLPPEEKAVWEGLKTDQEKAKYFVDTWIGKYNRFGSKYGADVAGVISDFGQKKNNQGDGRRLFFEGRLPNEQASELSQVFDLKGAIAAGHNEAEALELIKQNYYFDAPEAVKTGASIDDIHNYINSDEVFNKLSEHKRKVAEYDKRNEEFQKNPEAIENPDEFLGLENIEAKKKDNELKTKFQPQSDTFVEVTKTTPSDREIAQKYFNIDRDNTEVIRDTTSIDDDTFVETITTPSKQATTKKEFAAIDRNIINFIGRALTPSLKKGKDKEFVENLTKGTTEVTEDDQGRFVEITKSLPKEETSKRVDEYIESLDLNPIEKALRKLDIGVALKVDDIQRRNASDTKDIITQLSDIYVAEAEATASSTPEGKVAKFIDDTKRELKSGDLSPRIDELAGIARTMGLNEEVVELSRLNDLVSSTLATYGEDSDEFTKIKGRVVSMMPFITSRLAVQVGGQVIGGPAYTMAKAYNLYKSFVQGFGSEAYNTYRKVAMSGIDEDKVDEKTIEAIDRNAKTAVLFSGGYAVFELLSTLGLLGQFTKSGAGEFVREGLEQTAQEIGQEIMLDLSSTLGTKKIGVTDESIDEIFDMLGKTSINTVKEAGPAMFLLSAAGLAPNAILKAVAPKSKAESQQVTEAQPVITKEEAEAGIDELLSIDTDEIIEAEVEEVSDDEFAEGAPLTEEEKAILGQGESKRPEAVVTVDDAEARQVDTQRQVHEMEIHRQHMSNMLGRDVSEKEAALDWASKTPGQKESLAELYRDRHPFGEPVNVTKADTREASISLDRGLDSKIDKALIVSPDDTYHSKEEIVSAINDLFGDPATVEEATYNSFSLGNGYNLAFTENRLGYIQPVIRGSDGRMYDIDSYLANSEITAEDEFELMKLIDSEKSSVVEARTERLEASKVPEMIGKISELLGNKDGIVVKESSDVGGINALIRGVKDPDGGSIRYMPAKIDEAWTSLTNDGRRLIVLNAITKEASSISIALHELGHGVIFDNLWNESEGFIRSVFAEYQKSRKDFTGSADLIDAIIARSGGLPTSTLIGLEGQTVGGQTAKYQDWLDNFNEWLADQVSVWARTSDKPSSIIEQFFHDIAQTFKKIYNMIVKGKDKAPTLRAWLDGLAERGASNHPQTLGDSVRQSVRPEARKDGSALRTASPAQANQRIMNKINWLFRSEDYAKTLDLVSKKKADQFRRDRESIANDAVRLFEEFSEEDYFASMLGEDEYLRMSDQGTLEAVLEDLKSRAELGEVLSYAKAKELAERYSTIKTGKVTPKGIAKDVKEQVKKAERKAKPKKKKKAPRKIAPKPDIEKQLIERIEASNVEAIKDVDRARAAFIYNFTRKLKPSLIRTSLLTTVNNIKKIGDKNWRKAVKVHEGIVLRDAKRTALNEIKKTVDKLNKKGLNKENKKAFEEFNKKYDTTRLINSDHIERLKALEAEMARDAKLDVPTKVDKKLQKQVERLHKDFLGDLELEQMEALSEELSEILDRQVAAEKELKKAKTEKRKNIKKAFEKTSKEIAERVGAKDDFDLESAPLKRAMGRLGRLIKTSQDKSIALFTNPSTYAYVLDHGKGPITKHITDKLVKAQDTEITNYGAMQRSLIESIQATGVDISSWSNKEHYGVLNGVINLVKDAPRDKFVLGGKKIFLTKAEQVGLISTLYDPDGMRHALKGGLSLKDNNRTITFKPTGEELVNMLENVDSDVKKVVQALQVHLKGIPKTLLDNFTLGYQEKIITTNGYYYPLRVDREAIYNTESKKDNIDLDHVNISGVLGRFTNMYPTSGSTKRRSLGANQPLVIEDFVRTMTRYNTDIATYTAYQQTVAELTVLMDDLQRIMKAEGLGSQYTELFESYRAILEGSSAFRTSTIAAQTYNAIRSLAVKGTLALNPRVMAIQTASGLHYMLLPTDPKRKLELYARLPKIAAKMNVVEAIPFKETALEREIKEVSELARARFEDDMGGDFSDDRITHKSRNVINKNRKGLNTRRVADFMTTDQAIKSIGYGDKIGIKTMYLFAKEDVLLDGFKEGTKEFKQELRERFEDAIHRTQPTSYAVDRTKLASNPLFKSVTMYTNQRSKIFNEMIRAAIDIKYGLKSKDYKTASAGAMNLFHLTALNSTLISLLGSGVVGTAMWALLRGDEPEEEIMERYLKEQATLSLQNIMVVGDILSMFTNDEIFQATSFIGATKQDAQFLILALKKYKENPSRKNRERLNDAWWRLTKKTGNPFPNLKKWKEYVSGKEKK